MFAWIVLFFTTDYQSHFGQEKYLFVCTFSLQDLHEECQNTQPKLDKVFALNQNLQQLQNASPEAQARFTEDKDQIQAHWVTIDGSLAEGVKMIESTLMERKEFVNRCDGIQEQLKECKNQVEEWKHVFVDEVPTELDRNNVSRLKPLHIIIIIIYNTTFYSAFF